MVCLREDIPLLLGMCVYVCVGRGQLSHGWTLEMLLPTDTESMNFFIYGGTALPDFGSGGPRLSCSKRVLGEGGHCCPASGRKEAGSLQKQLHPQVHAE